MNDFEPLAVDCELRKCARRWIAFRRSLAQGETELANPFALSRPYCGRNAFNALRELVDDPVAPALSRWVYRFTEQRLNMGVLLAISEERKHQTHFIEEPVKAGVSLDHMLEQALMHEHGRKAWLSTLTKYTAFTHAIVVRLWEQRQELASRMKLASPDAIQAPCDELYRMAEQWLTNTDDLWQTPAEFGLEQLLEQALAHAANVNWPAHLNPRTLLGFFSESRLLEGLELDPGRLPRGISPASYLRALGRLGCAFLDASAPTDQPFAVAHDAYGLDRRCYGALFALLPMHPEFLRRRLGASSHVIEPARRALGISLLIESRLAALRVLLRRKAYAGGESLREAFQEQSSKACRVTLPGNAAGVIVQLHEDDLQRFAGLLLAARLNNLLLENHDTDWFRNPRAVDQLRSEAMLPPRVEREPADFANGMLALQRWLTEAIA